jgi:type II secretion system protein N
VPRWLVRLRRLGIPLAALLLTSFFVLIGFPWERVRERVAHQIGAATGSTLTIGSLAPAFGLFGPGFQASHVVVSWPDGRRFDLAEARVRPAPSLSWLRLRPALYVDAQTPQGRTSGKLTLGTPYRFAGSLSDIQLAALPTAQLIPGASLEGHAQLDGDLELRSDGPRGELRFEASEGSLTIPGLPIALPYTTLHGTLRFADETAIAIESLVLDGPMLSAQASGTLARAPQLQTAPLDMELRLEARDASLRPLLAQAGLRVGPDGSATVKITGTPSRPILR